MNNPNSRSVHAKTAAGEIRLPRGRGMINAGAGWMMLSRELVAEKWERRAEVTPDSMT
jgi:hypothetical protein